MTHPLHRIISGSAAAVLVAAPAFAIEAPPDNTPPPVLEPQQAEPEAPAENGGPARPATAYLGIATGPVPEMLASHLRLQPGEGVVIRGVVPEGPAAAAGITEHDVLTRIGGEPVGSPEELRHRTLAKQPGDEIEVDVIHEGTLVTRKVVLGSREQGLADAPHGLHQLMLDGMPDDQARRIREAIERHLQLNVPGVGAVAPLPKMGDVMREMQQQMDEIFQEMPDPLEPGAQGGFRADSTVRIKDNEGSIELKSTDGSKELTVRDSEDNIVWTGPWDTEQDRAAAPEDVRQRASVLNLDQNFKGNGLRFHFNWPQAPEAPLDEE